MKIKFSRRRFLTTGAGALGAIAMPNLSRAADRPAITHGVQSGDVTVDGGVVWARTDRPAQMLVEVATTESFKDARALPPIAALPESDFTAKMLVDNLPGGQDIFYRVRFRDLSHTAVEGEPVVGRFRTAPADRRDVSFVWGGDVAGQGWGINPDDGGMVTFAAMRKHRPDFLLHSGDTIYADGVIPSEVKLADGKIWKNVTIPEKAKVAETLDEYRAAHKYNFTDDNVRAFNAEVPIFVQWDDHEVTNNWSLSKDLPAGQDIFYRVRFRDLSHPDILSEPVVGRFRTAPADRRDVSVVWGGDVAGQGWGINPDDGGMFTFATMRKHRPDFLLHSGDTVYADGPIKSEVTLPDGKVWKNVTTPEKAKVAETLDEYRAAHKYNFLDSNVRAFSAEVPIFVQWDDHEVTNNWSLSKQLPAAYKERDITLLAARAASSEMSRTL